MEYCHGFHNSDTVAAMSVFKINYHTFPAEMVKEDKRVLESEQSLTQKKPHGCSDSNSEEKWYKIVLCDGPCYCSCYYFMSLFCFIWNRNMFEYFFSKQELIFQREKIVQIELI